MRSFFLVSTLFAFTAQAEEPIRLFPGYLTKIRCEGRLLVSAVGNEGLIRLEALPKELGCGVLLKPVGQSGKTNLILETSAGTIERVVTVEGSSGLSPQARELDYRLKGDPQ